MLNGLRSNDVGNPNPGIVEPGRRQSCAFHECIEDCPKHYTEYVDATNRSSGLYGELEPSEVGSGSIAHMIFESVSGRDTNQTGPLLQLASVLTYQAMQSVICFHNIYPFHWVTWEVHCWWCAFLLGPDMVHSYKTEVSRDCIPGDLYSLVVLHVG